MKFAFLGYTFFATGVCLAYLKLEIMFGHLLLSRQAPNLNLKRNIYFELGSDSLLKKIASDAHDLSSMRAWMTGLILAIFGLWLATI